MRAAVITVITLALTILGIRWLAIDHAWHRGGGQHKGVITAVDCNPGGLISDNSCKIYFKTNTTSAQEDIYYVRVGDPILDKLREAQDSGNTVLLKYDHIINRGVHLAEGDYITEIAK